MGRYDDRGGGDQLVYGTTAAGDEFPVLVDTDRKLIVAAELQDPGDATRKAEFDTLFQIPIFINVTHHEIHEGCSFTGDAVDTSMELSDTLILAFKTEDSTKRAHLFMEFSTLTGGHVDIIEGPTWTTDTGTLNPIYNRKREASMASSMLLEDLTATPTFTATDNMLLNPTGLAGGTTIQSHYGFGEKAKFGASGRDAQEIILKPDTRYAFRFTADVKSNQAQLLLNWYEHTDV